VNLSRLKEGISLFNGYFVLNALKWESFAHCNSKDGRVFGKFQKCW